MESLLESLKTLSKEELQSRAKLLKVPFSGTKEQLVQRLAEVERQRQKEKDHVPRPSKRKRSPSSSSSSDPSSSSESEAEETRKKQKKTGGKKRRRVQRSPSSSGSSSSASSDSDAGPDPEFDRENTRKQAEPLVSIRKELSRAKACLKKKKLRKARARLSKLESLTNRRLTEIQIADAYGWEVVDQMKKAKKIKGTKTFHKELLAAQHFVQSKKSAIPSRSSNRIPRSGASGTSLPTARATASQPFRAGLGADRPPRGCFKCGSTEHLSWQGLCKLEDIQAQFQRERQARGGRP